MRWLASVMVCCAAVRSSRAWSSRVGRRVLDALDEPHAAFQQCLAADEEGAAGHAVECDVDVGAVEAGAEGEVSVEAADLADQSVVAGGVAGRPFQVAVVRPAGVGHFGQSRFQPGDVSGGALDVVFGVAAGVDHMFSLRWWARYRRRSRLTSYWTVECSSSSGLPDEMALASAAVRVLESISSISRLSSLPRMS
jgi:hypothetical protein